MSASRIPWFFLSSNIFRYGHGVLVFLCRINSHIVVGPEHVLRKRVSLNSVQGSRSLTSMCFLNLSFVFIHEGLLTSTLSSRPSNTCPLGGNSEQGHSKQPGSSPICFFLHFVTTFIFPIVCCNGGLQSALKCRQPCQGLKRNTKHVMRSNSRECTAKRIHLTSFSRAPCFRFRAKNRALLCCKGESKSCVANASVSFASSFPVAT